MLRSMYSGVSGLKFNQMRMDVIGNNIANVNTIGFKKSRVNFTDALYQTLKGASSPTTSRGGVNAQAIGLGTGLGSIDLVASDGAPQTTGKTSDLMIQGDGFFVLQGPGGVSDKYYTRAGNFDFDATGNLINTSNGMLVMGYMAQNGVIGTTLSAISVSGLKSIPPQQTTKLFFEGNLKASTSNGDTFQNTQDVYDKLGQKHTLNLVFEKTNDNEWQLNITGDVVSSFTPVTLTFSNGKLTSSTTTTLTTTFGDINLDLSALTQYEADSSAWAGKTDPSDPMAKGYPAGSLSSYTIDQNGIITGRYDNGLTIPLAQLALATFDNPGGLNQVGQNIYKVSNNSGQANEGKVGTAGRGTVNPGSLEMSNVDLSEEFTNMISTQRAFQANSRIITTSDQMLEELVNLKR